MNLYTIHDTKADIHGEPWNAKTHVHAIRHFASGVNNPDRNNMLHHHAKDFQLVHLATFDEITGTLTAVPKTVIATAIGVLEEHDQDEDRPLDIGRIPQKRPA